MHQQCLLVLEVSLDLLMRRDLLQGYDPLLKMMSRWKKAKTYPNKMEDIVNRGKYGR